MEILRPVGNIGQLSTTRHALGLYHSVIVTARYSLQETSLKGDEIFEKVLYLALAGVIRHHPALRCSIHGEDSESPAFWRLESIDLHDHVISIRLKSSEVVQMLEQLHDERWTELERRPAWRVVVLRTPSKKGGPMNIDIAFVYHHALADGLSGAAFHRSFLEELQKATSTYEESMDIPTVIDVSRCKTELIEPVEKLLQMPLSWSFLASQALQEYAPRWLLGSSNPLWSGTKCQTLEELPYKTLLRVLSIPAAKVEALLNATRREKTTLTPLISATTIVALAKLVPAAERFVGLTPYTLRRVSGTSMDALVNQTSGFFTSYDDSLLHDLRKTPSEISLAADSTHPVWRIARHHQDTMKAELARCPRDIAVGMLPYISNYRHFFQKKIGQPHDCTFEVSNLGTFNSQSSRGSVTGRQGQLGQEDAPEGGSGGDVWTIEDMLFTQGAGVVGPAFTVNCASVSGGALNLAFAWQKGAVETAVVDGIVREFERLVSMA